jgi:two-component system, LytTR family, response regulator LytT
MKVLIIEDEEQAYARMQKIIKEVVTDAEVLAVIVSVKSAIKWFHDNAMPDLVFMDINLADGVSFEIFKEVTITAPIIFTTAYEEFAIQAFKVNSVAYLLKPVDKEAVTQALEKLHQLQAARPQITDYTTLLKTLQESTRVYRERFVVKLGDNLRSIAVEDIAYFFTENKTTFLCTREARKYPIDFNLDEVESMINPKKYFRINRQFIIGIAAIEEMKSYTRSRVIIKVKPPTNFDTIVSVERASDFRTWLGGE